ncbi:hypothetical protein SO694_00020059 [Aureococcus anophagefferens]|uniref:Uncharacterized protein n=1 Tax=Aureococcus anophagefferens TaxID=44056 RepID=A0ABR1FTY2_AURAN
MGAFECIERLYEARRSLTLFTLVVNLCFGMAFSITTFNVVGRCVTEPCVAETAGLLRINSGTSFGLLLTGFLFILQPVYGLWFFRVKCSDVVGGAFVGATVMLSLQAMMTSSQWSYVAKGVATMDPIVASSGVVVKGNETFFSAFEAIAALAGLMCALLILNAIELSFCLEYFCDNDAAKLRAQRFAERIRRGYQYQGVHQSSDATVDDDDLDDDTQAAPHARASAAATIESAKRAAEVGVTIEHARVCACSAASRPCVVYGCAKAKRALAALAGAAAPPDQAASSRASRAATTASPDGDDVAARPKAPRISVAAPPARLSPTPHASDAAAAPESPTTPVSPPPSEPATTKLDAKPRPAAARPALAAAPAALAAAPSPLSPRSADAVRAIPRSPSFSAAASSLLGLSASCTKQKPSLSPSKALPSPLATISSLKAC